MEVERWLSAAEIAVIVGKSSKTVRNWARRGLIPGVRFGGKDWMFQASEVEAAIKRAALPQPTTGVARQGRGPGRYDPAPNQAVLSIRERLRRHREQAATR